MTELAARQTTATVGETPREQDTAAGPLGRVGHRALSFLAITRHYLLRGGIGNGPKEFRDYGTIISEFVLLGFGCGRWQFPCHHRVLEPHPAVGAIAKRFIGGVAAAAQRNDGTARQPESGAAGVDNLELALNADGAVILRRDSG